LNSFVTWIEGQGAWSPLLLVALFLASSLLMIWALEAMNAGGSKAPSSAHSSRPIAPASETCWWRLSWDAMADRGLTS